MKTFEGTKRGEQPRVTVHDGEAERPLPVEAPDWGGDSEGSLRLAGAMLKEAGVTTEGLEVMFAFSVLNGVGPEWSLSEQFVREWAEGK